MGPSNLTYDILVLSLPDDVLGLSNPIYDTLGLSLLDDTLQSLNISL